MVGKLAFVLVGMFGMAVWGWRLWRLLVRQTTVDRQVPAEQPLSRGHHPIMYWGQTVLMVLLFAAMTWVTGYALVLALR